MVFYNTVLRNRKDKNVHVTEAIINVGLQEGQLKLKDVETLFNLLLSCV